MKATVSNTRVSSRQPMNQMHAATQQRCVRVLIVDDNADVADSLSMLFRLYGHHVCTAYDGLSAIEEGRRFQPDVAIVDISMPGLSGYDVARTLREVCGDKLLLVAVTALSRIQDKLRARQAGVDHHMAKPVDFEELRSLLPS